MYLFCTNRVYCLSSVGDSVLMLLCNARPARPICMAGKQGATFMQRSVLKLCFVHAKNKGGAMKFEHLDFEPLQ